MTAQRPDASIIAIVDDHEAVRRSASSLLGSMGYSVVGFASGEEFLTAESSATMGCVLLDMKMPGSMNGLSVLRSLRKRGSPIRVVILTGRVDQRTASAAMSLGAIEVLEKPCGPFRLADSIARAFRMRGSRLYARPTAGNC